MLTSILGLFPEVARLAAGNEAGNEAGLEAGREVLIAGPPLSLAIRHRAPLAIIRVLVEADITCIYQIIIGSRETMLRSCFAWLQRRGCQVSR